MESAIAREKQIKGGSRKKKLALIESMNLDWRIYTKKSAGSVIVSVSEAIQRATPVAQ